MVVWENGLMRGVNLVDVRGGIGGKCGGSISLKGVGFSLVSSGWVLDGVMVGCDL